jgi:hypothetical protein
MFIELKNIRAYSGVSLFSKDRELIIFKTKQNEPESKNRFPEY